MPGKKGIKMKWSEKYVDANGSPVKRRGQCYLPEPSHDHRYEYPQPAIPGAFPDMIEVFCEPPSTSWGLHNAPRAANNNNYDYSRQNKNNASRREPYSYRRDTYADRNYTRRRLPEPPRIWEVDDDEEEAADSQSQSTWFERIKSYCGIAPSTSSKSAPESRYEPRRYDPQPRYDRQPCYDIQPRYETWYEPQPLYDYMPQYAFMPGGFIVEESYTAGFYCMM